MFNRGVIDTNSLIYEMRSYAEAYSAIEILFLQQCNDHFLIRKIRVQNQ
jgi:hypothetical protein